MSKLIYALMGQRVYLTSTDGVMVATDEGVLEAYDGQVVRLRKDHELLYFPMHNVQDIMSASSNGGTGVAAPMGTDQHLLRELVGEQVHVFPNPHLLRVDGVLEDADEHVIRLRTRAGSRDGAEHSLYQPLTRIRLIKPNP